MVGAKLTVMVHAPLAGMLVPQVLTWLYAEDPLIETLMLVNATF